VDKATASQICDLAHVIDTFTEQCEKVSSKTSTALRSAFKVQVCELLLLLLLLFIAQQSKLFIWEKHYLVFHVQLCVPKCYCLIPCYVNPIL
jgi:hypothetical protein